VLWSEPGFPGLGLHAMPRASVFDRPGPFAGKSHTSNLSMLPPSVAHEAGGGQFVAVTVAADNTGSSAGLNSPAGSTRVQPEGTASAPNGRRTAPRLGFDLTGHILRTRTGRRDSLQPPGCMVQLLGSVAGDLA